MHSSPYLPGSKSTLLDDWKRARPSLLSFLSSPPTSTSHPSSPVPFYRLIACSHSRGARRKVSRPGVDGRGKGNALVCGSTTSGSGGGGGMSSRKGKSGAPQKRRAKGKAGRVPRYQNAFTFKHNSKSKKTDYIQGLHHSGLCRRCNDKIEWKKKYRKYKPLKKPRKCKHCMQPRVRRAYHVICAQCARDKNCCAWCLKDASTAEGKIVVTETMRQEAEEKQEKQLLDTLGGIRERDRRTIMRQIEQGHQTAEDIVAELGREQQDEDDGGVGAGGAGGAQVVAEKSEQENSGAAMDVDD